MGQVLHGTATTTRATRAKIQASEESVSQLAERYLSTPRRRGNGNSAIMLKTCPVVVVLVKVACWTVAMKQ